MDIHEWLKWTGGLLAFILYFPLIKGILRKENSIEQNLATWALWVSLDLIALISIIVQKGNFILLVSYVTGGTIVTLALIYTRQFKWTWFESFVLFLVFVCVIIWTSSGPRWATVASTLAVAISGLPQLKDTWAKPDKGTGLIYLGYTLANLISTFAGKEWSIEERFYPASCTLLCLVITAAAFRKRKLNYAHL